MHKLGVIVPYRNRFEQLTLFKEKIVEYLKSKEINFEIIVVEQDNAKLFNRGMLLNIGFKHAKEKGCDYVVFHDVDMLPVDSDYSYVDIPTHLATRAEQFGWRLPYEGYFGGVTLFDRENFIKINGYSNEYWGWGAEDDDVLFRCSVLEVPASRKDCSYRSLSHDRFIPQDLYNENLRKLRDIQTNATKEKIFSDGIETLEYEKIKEEKLSEFCTILDVKL